MVDIFLPTLHTFAMNNIFTGSWQAFRFRAVQCWHGPWCYEKSTMEDSATFPMSEEGRLDLKKWLEDRV